MACIETVADLQALLSILGPKGGDNNEAIGGSIGELVGKSVFIRTVTYFYVGKLLAAGQCLVLSEASWVAQTGRMAEFMSSGVITTTEAEPYPPGRPVYIPFGAVVETTEWPYDLPKKAV